MSKAFLHFENNQFQLSGVLNFTTVPELFFKTENLLSCAGEIVVNLQNISYSNSSGLALLAEWVRRAKKADKSIVFINMPTQMQAIAQLTEILDILPSDLR